MIPCPARTLSSIARGCGGDADAFQSAVIGATQAERLFAEATTTWRDGIVGREKDGRRLVSVFVSAVDYADEAGRNAA